MIEHNQQRQILELLETFKEAQSACLYADCFDVAVTLGEFIESLMGEGTQTVSLLEEYCELLYKADSEEIEEKLLNKHLKQIENCVKEELKPGCTETAPRSCMAIMRGNTVSVCSEAGLISGRGDRWAPVSYRHSLRKEQNMQWLFSNCGEYSIINPGNMFRDQSRGKELRH